MIKALISALFFAAGIFLFFSGIFGLFKFNYVMNRMHAIALGDTFGIIFIVIGCIILKGFSMASLKMVIIPVFMFLTGPVVTHLIGQVEVLSHKNENEEYVEEDRR